MTTSRVALVAAAPTSWARSPSATSWRAGAGCRRAQGRQRQRGRDQRHAQRGPRGRPARLRARLRQGRGGRAGSRCAWSRRDRVPALGRGGGRARPHVPGLAALPRRQGRGHRRGRVPAAGARWPTVGASLAFALVLAAHPLRVAGLDRGRGRPGRGRLPARAPPPVGVACGGGPGAADRVEAPRRTSQRIAAGHGEPRWARARTARHEPSPCSAAGSWGTALAAHLARAGTTCASGCATPAVAREITERARGRARLPARRLPARRPSRATDGPRRAWPRSAPTVARGRSLRSSAARSTAPSGRTCGRGRGAGLRHQGPRARDASAA